MKFSCALFGLLMTTSDAQLGGVGRSLRAGGGSLWNNRNLQVNCGNGNVGNGVCADPSLCCSAWGHCGSTDVYCGSASNGGTCGSGNVGNGICPDSSLCCSRWGHCGTGPEFCSSSSTENNNNCGNGVVGNGICSDPGLCCSQWGHCGTGPEFCIGGDESTSGGGDDGSASDGDSTVPCGNGVVGNGVCSDPTLCCSEWGHCGASSAHCGTSTEENTGNGDGGDGGDNGDGSDGGDGGDNGDGSDGGDGGDGNDGGNDGDGGTDEDNIEFVTGESAYITYHLYYEGQSTNEISCSDGANGLQQQFGYFTLDPMLPYVSATSNIVWNSPLCGTCYELQSSIATVYVSAVDQCGLGPEGEMHFDMHPDAFTELLGDAGIAAGHGYATFKAVDPSNCRGNA